MLISKRPNTDLHLTVLAGRSLPSNRSTWTTRTQALLSKRGRPRPPPLSRTQEFHSLVLLLSWIGPPTVRLLSIRMKTSVRRGRLASVWFRCFCSTGAPEDGRAPTEELSCVRLRCFCSTGVNYAKRWSLPISDCRLVAGLQLAQAGNPM